MVMEARIILSAWLTPAHTRTPARTRAAGHQRKRRHQERAAAALGRSAVHAVAGVRRLPRHAAARRRAATRPACPACCTRTSTIRAASALLTFDAGSDAFVDRVRPLLQSAGRSRRSTRSPSTRCSAGPTRSATSRISTTSLLHRPRRTVLNPDWHWAVWYPLRRSGRFAQLPPEEQRVILAEHGTIGMSFGAADYAHDIRLACHGLDKNDNDFVIGLIGKDLFRCRRSSRRCEDAADVAVPGAARSVLRRPRALAERSCRPSLDRSSRRRQAVIALRPRVAAKVGGRRWLGRLLVRVGELDERRLAPRAAEKRQPDRQPCQQPIGTVMCG